MYMTHEYVRNLVVGFPTRPRREDEINAL